MNEYLPHEIADIHKVLNEAGIPHGFGGAVAFAYWGTPRYTHDVDVNIALSVDEHERVLDAIENAFAIQDREKARRDLSSMGQTRLKWGDVPVDLFFANTDYHLVIDLRVRKVEYIDIDIPVLSAEDLIITKALFNRGKDWIDIENVIQVQSALDEGYIRHWIEAFVGTDDVRLIRLDQLLEQHRGEAV
jgi:hypothetical protein